MLHLIETGYKDGILDAAGESLRKDMPDLGITGVAGLKTVQLYKIDSDIGVPGLKEICRKLLADPVTQYYRVDAGTAPVRGEKQFSVEVWLKNGVTDAGGDTVVTGIKDLGFTQEIKTVHTGTRYILSGDGLTKNDMETAAKRLLANPIIQDYKLL